MLYICVNMYKLWFMRLSCDRLSCPNICHLFQENLGLDIRLMEEKVFARSQWEQDKVERQNASKDGPHDGGRVGEEDKHTMEFDREAYETLAKTLRESLNMEPPPGEAEGTVKALKSEQPADSCKQHLDEKSLRTCCGCFTELGQEKLLTLDASSWHLCCFRCQECHKRITPHGDEFVVRAARRLYHRTCYEELKSRPKENQRGKCFVCEKRFLQGTQIKFHQFWKQEYCPSHEEDGTASCCSCERLEPKGKDNTYRILEDGRKLCPECLESAIMGTIQCQELYFEIREFFEGLHMKVEQEFPLLLVEKQALNAVVEGESCNHHDVKETRGLCLSEELTITSVLRGPKQEGNKLTGLELESQILSRKCEVTAILILYGLPRLLTGSILAHMLMHAWFRLHGCQTLGLEVEEGMCQVMAHMWLESQRYSAAGDAGSSWFSSSSAPPKQGRESKMEKKLLELFMYLIESCTSREYGDGFRKGMKAVEKHGLASTLNHILKTGNFPTD